MSTPGSVVLEGCHIATADAGGTEHTDGYVVVDGGVIAALSDQDARRSAMTSHMSTPAARC